MTLNQRRRSILPPYSSHPEEMVDKIDLSRYEVDGDYYLSSTVFRVSFPSDFLLRQYATLLQVENRVFKIPWVGVSHRCLQSFCGLIQLASAKYEPCT